MTDSKIYHLAASAIGLGAAALTAVIAPSFDWVLLGIVALSGYAGGLLPDIDNTDSSGFHTIKKLSKIAAVIVPSIQFIYRPADLLLAIPVALFMLSQFWEFLPRTMKRGGHTHSILGAICLSMGVTWIAYLTVGQAAILPAFMAANTSYLLHLWLEDMYRKKYPDPEIDAQPALTAVGNGRSAELYSLIAIGFISLFGLFGL